MNQDEVVTNSRGAAAHITDLPDSAEITELLLSASRPFVLVGDRELSVLRRGLTKNGWKRSLYLQDAPSDPSVIRGAGLLAQANRWLKDEIRIPERSGSFDDFTCEDGTPLEMPRLPIQPGAVYHCPACGRTYSGEPYDGAVRWLQHQALANGCLALALICQIDRNLDYGSKAVEILSKYAQAYPGLHTGPTTGGMLHRSIDEARWLVPLAQAYDLVYHHKSISSTQRDMIENKLMRASALGLLTSDADDDWAAWSVAAAGAVGLANKDITLVIPVIEKFKSVLSRHLSDGGMWPQSAPDDHFSALAAFINLAEPCRRIGIDLYNYETEGGRGLKSMFLEPLAWAYPSLELPALDDVRCHPILPLELYEVANRRWCDPVFAWVLRTGYGFSRAPVCEVHFSRHSEFIRDSLCAFLMGRDLPGRVQAPKFSSMNFHQIQACTLRSGSDAMLTFHYGSEGKHLDPLGITLYANDKALCADYGSTLYGEAAVDYYAQPASHNTVIVDGRMQQEQHKSELLAFYPGDYLQMTEARSGRYQGVEHSRRVVMAEDVILIQDGLLSDSEHVYDWLLGCEGELQDVLNSQALPVGLSKWFMDARASKPADSFIVRWYDGESGLALWLGTDGMSRLITARRPAESLARTVPVIGLRHEGRMVRYTAVLVPYRGEPPVVERCGKTLKVTRGDVVDWVFSIDAPAEAVNDQNELETDAQIAAVREINGKIICCGLYGGGFIDLKGTPIVLGAGPFRRLEVRLDSGSPTVSFDGSSGGHLRIRCNSRAMRVNGHRISAAGIDGMATIKLVGVLAGL